jgi:RnfABCDGE-type electron transport complex C subunit
VIKLSRDEILNKIKNAGVVGAGGAGFPTHVKVDTQVEKIIINGAECEPLLRVDQQLMAVETQKLINGIEIVMEAAGAKETIIGLKGKYKEAISQLEKKIKGKPIKLFILEDFFPAGDEQVLVYEITKRIIPEGGIPLKVGCVVTNVETVINVAEAIDDGPVTETYLTVTGEVPEPVTIKLPVGTSIAEAAALSGIEKLDDMKIIDGGPMMGNVIEDHTAPITKTTKGIIVLPKDHYLIKTKTQSIKNIIKRAKSACIQCEYCTEMCPRNLMGHKLKPHQIMRSLNYGSDYDGAAKMAFTCSECGVCELYACPMGLSPRIINQALKNELQKKDVKPNEPSKELNAHTVREYRKIPVKRLITRLNIGMYNKNAALKEINYEPQTVKIKLSQHIGKPGKPTVKTGQEVEKGELIAKIPEKSLGANIHASIKGIVKKITDDEIIINRHQGGSD